MFNGMGPITSKSLQPWQRGGEGEPSPRALYLAYGLVVLAIGIFLWVWLH